MEIQPIDIVRKYNYWDNIPLEQGYPRLEYLKNLSDLLGNHLVKVILGQRRSGKSHLMRALLTQLIQSQQITPEQCLYINMELHDFSFIKNADDLMKLIATYRESLKVQGKIYIFLDEVQEIEGWEKAVNSLSQNHLEPAEVIITGSNANLLSGELATYLSGRYLTLTVYPFSYEEYLQVIGQPRNKSSLIQYLNEGGLPELYSLPNPETKFNYVQSLLDSIVLRDIVQRNQIREVDLLKKIIHFATDSVGSMLSIPSLVKILKSQGYKTNPETLANYLHYCMNAFYLHDCARYDIRGKQILTGEKKYYLNDLAFNRIAHTGFDSRTHRFLENAVYLSLLRQGYQVHVGRIDNKEIDFIAEKQNEKIYIQVAYLLPDKRVIEREFGNLLLIHDNYPKWVVSMDEDPIGNIEGILHQPAWKIIT